MTLAPLYCIADAATLTANGMTATAFAREIHAAGVTLLQLRDKTSGPQQILRTAADIQAIMHSRLTPHTAHLAQATLILNDRADLAALAGWGVHVGHRDLTPADARRVLGPSRTLGVSTHSLEQVQAADQSEADYIAIGPIFSTTTKLDAEPVVGLDFIAKARTLTRKPLVAIGGITLANARSVIDAGADSVAVISGLFLPGRSVRDVAQDFLARLR